MNQIIPIQPAESAPMASNTPLGSNPAGQCDSPFLVDYIPQRKDPGQWRFTKRIVGEINGLPQSRGVLVATNGILCRIERVALPPFEGHLDAFVSDSALMRQYDLTKDIPEGFVRRKKSERRKEKDALAWLDDFDV